MAGPSPKQARETLDAILERTFRDDPDGIPPHVAKAAAEAIDAYEKLTAATARLAEFLAID